MELVISVGIISTAILLVVGVFTFLFKSSQKSVDMTSGTVVAESIMQDMMFRIMYDHTTRVNFYNSDVAGMYASETAVEVSSRSYNGSQYFYTIYLTDCSGLGSNSANPMCKMSVVVNWWDQGGGIPGRSRSGYGTLAVELTRLIVYSGTY